MSIGDLILMILDIVGKSAFAIKSINDVYPLLQKIWKKIKNKKNRR